MNIFQSIVNQAVASGVSEQTIVMFLLLPLVASVVAAARHLIGFRGFGILIPTAIALAFVATGIGVGLLVFAVILMLATLARALLKRTRLHYLPRMALLLWFVSLGVLGLILASPYLKLGQLTAISIFSVLILILLAEEFITVQISKSLREATKLTLETVVIALVGFAIFNFEPLQWFALHYPQWVILAPLLLNLLIGKFTGLRLLEYRRFRRLLK
jgi:hypothetical protein